MRIPSILLLGAAVLCLSTGCRRGNGPGDPGDLDDGGINPGQNDAGARQYDDFPEAPINVDGPTDAPTVFGPPGTGASSGGPCLVEPQTGSLFPRDWLPPRFVFSPPAGQDLFEIRVSTPRQRTALVVYTRQTTWVMPRALWGLLARHVVDEDITFTIRGAGHNGSTVTATPAAGTTGTFRVAPAAADGSIVYWTTSNGTALKGFQVGNTDTVARLTPPQASTGCIGCHTSTPDGLHVGFSAASSPTNGGTASFGLRSVDGNGFLPPYLTASAQSLLARTSQQAPTFSKSHWQTGDRIGVNVMTVGGVSHLIWTDLEASSTAEGIGWGVIARTGDSRGAGGPHFSHDGTRLVYVSSSSIGSGVSSDSNGDVWTVPYNNRAGGNATAVPGASTPEWQEHYPNLSADDRYLAFIRVPANETSYNNAHAEVFVLPLAGGEAHRLVANDPNACIGSTSPGVTNSWPKWGPTATRVESRTFYWLTFSSTRQPGGLPQLFVSPVVVTHSELGGDTVQSYPALYLWNQPANEANHTPAWDFFVLEPYLD